ncbi:hypothetical protein [Laspinema olomoucense]|uniref:hypothetical protein n=1 Tax=Laspinema olomoucense TaxID=3231600 RepID=UPI0021BB7E16|nr:hypothetical protein [Laspinema sp. D3c]MCT7996991.1 hypothetical protein [Laspinema sp. D3c]
MGEITCQWRTGSSVKQDEPKGNQESKNDRGAIVTQKSAIAPKLVSIENESWKIRLIFN